MARKVKHVKKPWGGEEHFIYNEKSTVKILWLKPNQKLSLQTHKKREEMWYALDSGLYAVKGNKEFKLKKGEPFFIPKHTKHRLLSKSKGGRVLEIAFGKYIAEDIVRLEDKYAREGTVKP